MEANDRIPIQPLIALKGALNNLLLQFLKDDGCNTNKESDQLLDRN